MGFQAADQNPSRRQADRLYEMSRHRMQRSVLPLNRQSEDKIYQKRQKRKN